MTAAIPAEAFEHGDPKRYRRGCRCQLCTTAVGNQGQRNKFLRETGRGYLRPVAAAARHIRKLRATGLSDQQIRQAARICPDVLYRVLRGEGKIHIKTEQRILAVPVKQAAKIESAAKTNAAGTHRRLRALVAAGWPSTELARRLGVTKEWAGYLLHGGGNGSVEIRTAIKVKALFGELWDQQPEQHGIAPHVAHRARLLAVRRGWHPAAVWDDIDNPDDAPQYGAQVSRPVAIVENTAELVRQGLSREAIAARLGVTWNYVQIAHVRLGVPMPELAA